MLIQPTDKYYIKKSNHSLKVIYTIWINQLEKSNLGFGMQ